VVARLQGGSLDCGIYARRRDLFCRILTETGYTFTPPKGAFYVFPKSPLADDVEFVNRKLRAMRLSSPSCHIVVIFPTRLAVHYEYEDMAITIISAPKPALNVTFRNDAGWEMVSVQKKMSGDSFIVCNSL
jgi:hypothetical protein